MEPLAAWNTLKTNVLFLIIVCTQLLLSDSSPLSQETISDNGACSKGWVHYQRFCVTQAKGESDAAVALYCDGFGGVGINGYCITKAHNTVDSFESSKQESDSLGQELSLGDFIDQPQVLPDQYRPDTVIEEVACPKGWKHYGKICVYQPLSVKEQCHLLNAVAFSGLCLKHADTDAIEKRGLTQTATENDGQSRQEKRICCCAHVRGKYNGYGCM